MSVVAGFVNVLSPLLATWVLGDLYIHPSVLSRLYSIHYIAALVSGVLAGHHLLWLHLTGSHHELRPRTYAIAFPLWFVFKYSLSALGLLACLTGVLGIWSEDLENNQAANALVTPLAIVPEAYFVYMFTMLRAISLKPVALLDLVLYMGTIQSLVSRWHRHR